MFLTLLIVNDVDDDVGDAHAADVLTIMPMARVIMMAMLLMTKMKKTMMLVRFCSLASSQGVCCLLWTFISAALRHDMGKTVFPSRP